MTGPGSRTHLGIADRGKVTSKAREHGGHVNDDVYVLDAYAGTGTSGCLFALRRVENSKVVCVERDMPADYLKQHLPRKYWSRVMLIQTDVRHLNCDDLYRRMRRTWPSFRPSRFALLHASPGCQTHSRADRGFSSHRDRLGATVNQERPRG